jgi:transposase|eukprot:COSAG01_NODE_9101_length_2554_cov_139.263544_2_plen_55_part_00
MCDVRVLQIHWGANDCDVANELVRLVKAKGGRVFFTPPYCPDANAIEWYVRCCM